MRKEKEPRLTYEYIPKWIKLDFRCSHCQQLIPATDWQKKHNNARTSLAHVLCEGCQQYNWVCLCPFKGLEVWRSSRNNRWLD